MKKCYLILFSSFCFFIIWPSSIYATMPVVDYAAIAKLGQELQKLDKQYKLLEKNYNNAVQQLEQEKKIIIDMEGHYGMGDLKNSLQDLKNREWSPDNWNDALKGLAGGNPERYQELVQEYQKNHVILSIEDYQKGASKELAQDYEQQIAVNQASQVQASYAFNDIKQHLETVHTLSQSIEKALNTKAAIDLNSRILTEMSYISIQELKMQSLINQQLAQKQASVIFEETQAAKANRLPDE